MDNVMSIYWQLLVEVEVMTDPQKDKLNKLLVEGAYNLLNRCDFYPNKPQPRWLRQEKENESN